MTYANDLGSQRVSITPVDAACGAEVRGVDLARDLNDDLMLRLTTALYEHRVLVIKDQNFDQESYRRFGQQWGTPIRSVLAHMRLGGYPEMMAVGNTEEKDKSDEIRLGSGLWHTDQSYEKVPASATMLYSILVPRTGGETRFADTVAAYEALEPETQARLDTQMVSHLYGAARRREDEHAACPLVNEEQRGNVPPCKHPLVRRHPVTGHRALYAVGQSPYAIDGLPENEAQALLWNLREHCIQDRFVYTHKYAVGDLVIFDTFSTLHAASPIEVVDPAEDNARLLWRISVRGLPLVVQESYQKSDG